MNPLVVYKASAGSGKTFTLAVQYIKLLVMAEEPGEYARVLAVTFTNKATTEMKDRILSQLYGIGHGLRSSKVYFKALKVALKESSIPPLSDDEIRRRCREALHQILHDYSRFRVQTIDAFFQMVLRGLAHELGLTANLQVEISDTEVLSKAVDRIIDRLQDDPQIFEWILSLVRDRIAGDQRWDVTREVKDFGRTIFNEDYLMRGDQLRTVLSDSQFIRSFMQQLKEREENAIDIIKLLGNQLEKTVYDAGVSYTDFSNGNTLRSFVEKLKAGDLTVDAGARILQWIDDPLKLVRRADQAQCPELMAIADEISGQLDNAVRRLQTALYSVNSARLAQAHLKPLCLLDAIDREVAAINAETSRFNLAKTPILLSRMIGESDAPFVFEKLGALLRHVMIDEFQDTSRLQWHNFCALLLESYAKGGSNLLVGDVKQSIYRWRGGDWRVLGDIQHQITPQPLIRHLDVNRRSARNVIQFNNVFFRAAAVELDHLSEAEEKAMEGDFSFASAYSDVEQRIPEERPSEGYVGLRVLSPETYKRREDWQPVVLDELKEQICSLHEQGLPYSQMTILVRNNFEMESIIDCFADATDWANRPAIVSDEAFLLSASPAVSVLIAALRVLVKPDDPVASYYLHATAPHLPDDGLDAKLAELPLYELLETLYALLDLSRMPLQDAYLFAFFDAAADFLYSQGADIHAFLTYWDERLSRQSIPADAVDGIRVITIHKAKGLEFHTVLMPFCTWAFERDRSNDLLWCTPTEAPYDELSLLPITPNSRMAPKSAFARDYAQSHLLSRLDELNTLYVAFTRPKKNLLAWAVGNADGLSKSKRTVGDLIASIYPDGCEIGDPVLSVEVKDDEQDNRLLLDYKPFSVHMQSYPLHATFRQSNRSQMLLASFAEETDDAAASEPVRSRQYIEMGLLLHSVLQQIATEADISRVLDSLEHEGVISRFADDGSYVTVRRSDVEQWLEKGLEDPLVASWFDGSWTLFSECAILTTDKEGRPKAPRPDRVMVSADGRLAVVVDFKFGRPHEGYDEQVSDYMRLLSQMLPEARVEGYLWFVYSGKVSPVSPQTDASRQITLDF